ncbi:MAG: IPExxxVDY family protein [Bacteroidota bacterium]
MAVKKHKLEMAINEDFCLLGLVSDEPDYKLCWLINHSLGTDLLKLDDLELFHKRLGKDLAYSIFAFQDEESLLTYRIIKNRAEEGYFLDELKNLDYLVHIQGEINAKKINSFIRGVKAIPEVRMCVPVDLKKIRNQERLLLW